MEVSIGWGFEVSWTNGTRIVYNPRFSQRRPSARFSYSVPLRPDIARQVQAALVFDTADLAFDLRTAQEAGPDMVQTTMSDVFDLHAALAP